MLYPPNLCTSVQSVGVFVGGYGIPAILTLPSEFLPQNPFQVCLRKSSHGIHGIHRNFWRRIFSHRFHRCSQIFRLRFCLLICAHPCNPWGGRRRVWHPCHTHAALRIPSTEPISNLFAQVLPQNSQNSQKLQAEDILPRISQNTQKLQAEDILPQISQMYTDFSSPPVVSVCSVNSVGR